jgi:putative sterol carrier protein
VEDLVSFEMNKDYTVIIEKKAENLYRTISQKMRSLPTSNQAVKQSVLRTPQMDLTPQESEQLSKYVSDDSYVKKQKEDIRELASMFKDMLGKTGVEEDSAYVEQFRSHFIPQEEFQARYLFLLEGRKQPLFVEVNGDELDIHYGQEENIDIYAKMLPEVMESIVAGRMTFQRAFMTGEMTAKGNFKILRMLDTVFNFA